MMALGKREVRHGELLWTFRKDCSVEVQTVDSTSFTGSQIVQYTLFVVHVQEVVQI